MRQSLFLKPIALFKSKLQHSCISMNFFGILRTLFKKKQLLATALKSI